MRDRWEKTFTKALEKHLRSPELGPYLREQEEARQMEIEEAQRQLLSDLHAGKFDDFFA